MRQILPKWRSVKMTWLVSYIVILIVPVLFSTALYWEAQRTIDDQIRRANDTLLKQMQDAIDNEVAQVNRLTNEIYSNVRVRDLFYSNKFARDDYRYDLYQITQALGAYRTSYSNLDEFYIYWSAGDLVLTPLVYKPSELLYDDLYRESELTLEKWKIRINNTSDRQTLYTSGVNEAGRKMSYVSFISPFPADSNNQPVGSTVVMIDSNKLLHTISGIGQYNSSDVFILNERHEVIVSNSDKQGVKLPVEQFPLSSGNVYGKYYGKDSQYFYIKSNTSKLTYVSVVPASLVWEASSYMRNIAIVSIVFSLLGGCILTLFFLRRNYKPLGRLMESFAVYAGVSGEKAGNEFHFIQNALNHQLNEQEQVNLRLRQQQNQLRSHMISRLLKGRLDAGLSLEEALPALQPDFATDHFCVLLMYLEESEAFFEKIEHLHVADKLKLMQFIVTNVAEELINRRHVGFMAEVDDMLACLVQLKGDFAGTAEEQLEQIAEEAQQFLLNKFDIEVTIAISGAHHSQLEIPQAYNEALDAMEYKLIVGKQKIIAYEDVRKGEAFPFKEGYYYPLQIEQQLINFVKFGDVDKARSALNEIIDRNFHQMSLTVELAKCLFFNLVSTFIKTMNEIGDVQETFFTRHPQAISNLINSQTVDEMHRQLMVMLEDVCRLTAAKQEAIKLKIKEDGLSELAQNIITYVEHNYTDANLNISMLGEAFQMKATYLSKLFKDQTGESLLEHINKVRIEKAKELLKDGKMSIQEAANRCGFNELNTFIRTFKKLEGITPGKYKIF